VREVQVTLRQLRARWATRQLKIPQKVLKEVDLQLRDLPVDLDFPMEMILRKAYVLADDWKITAPELMSQLMPE
jgi:hypothetical protein